MASRGLSSPERGGSMADRSFLERRSNAVSRSQGRGVEEDPIGGAGDDRCLTLPPWPWWGRSARARWRGGKGWGSLWRVRGRSCNGDGWAFQAAVEGRVRPQCTRPVRRNAAQ
ncbi:hypothetical protein ACP70R_021641 [Stipagrostis hirtigluma subsp. patula]